ncbi:hypothetical protein QQS21_004081 [Conoideocrella luteorostrata]|uniref:Uncharacterized protein n=1 Tax=Conoideocrella luteorostrata TaxID=1105319 RepID=A0AAJ0CSZ5_9HYPO|nr:hypothetical protein QQS21_004081 [Conoideocrella luteorostrata]
MAPPSAKANYKTYEAQARMVRAIVAAHPEVKWNYKEIALCYGSDMTEHALNHRFRKIRAHGSIIKLAREEGYDMRSLSVDENSLPSTKEAVDKQNIAKYFGQSTTDGIQFQFRTIKKDAEKLRSVESSGGDVANCLPFTPSKSTSTPVSRTPASRATATPSSTARKRTRPALKRSSSDNDDDDGDGSAHDLVEDWSEKDDNTTPSKRPSKHAKTGSALPGQRTGTPSRRAAARANVTIANASAQLIRDETTPDVDEADEPDEQQAAAATPTYTSIFGDTDRKPLVLSNGQAVDVRSGLGLGLQLDPGPGPDPGSNTGLNTFSTDPYMSSTMNRSMYSDSFYRPDENGYGEDGEI